MEVAAPEAGARAAAAVEANSRRWPRIPTPIVVAVVGVVLGSWLVPAFTRQWDDRQKAGELKALLVAEIASATGRALMDANEASVAPTRAARSARSTFPLAGKEWSVANLRIRARLQAYFEPGAVEHWALVSQYVTSTLSRAYRSAAGDAVIPNPWVSRRPSPRLAARFRQYLKNRHMIEGLEMEIILEEEKLMTSLLAMHVRGYSTTWRDFVSDLFP
jgi:hypothetical protein